MKSSLDAPDSVKRPSYFFVWGETWRSKAAEPGKEENTVSLHPFSMTLAELTEYLNLLQQTNGLTLPSAMLDVLINPSTQNLAQSYQSNNSLDSLEPPTRGGEQILALPAEWDSETVVPWHSATHLLTAKRPLLLQPWRVEGLCLSPQVAMAFLTALPLRAEHSEDTYMGGDLGFWSHAARWSLDLLARAKFLPALEELANGERQASWQPLLDSAIDQARFKALAEKMPTVCRVYQELPPVPAALAVEIPPEPEIILTRFLKQVIDSEIRACLEPDLIAAVDKAGTDPVFVDWLRALGPGLPILKAEAQEAERLQSALNNWTAPLQQSLWQQNSFRTCFKLHPPTIGTDWTLEFFLQAIDKPALLIPADVVWSTPTEQLTYLDRTVERPQETLLLGLGLASRVYPLIESSLESARPSQHSLNPSQVYEFLKAAAWRLEDSGFGVILPPSLANREGWANRLGLKIRAQSPQLAKADSLGLASLLNFKWELSIGGQSLSKAEFDRLVAQHTPLVEINGEWVELRPQDVKAAQAFFAARKNQTGLSLEDALRISTGDTLTLDKLPVVSFEAAGPLQELLTTLTGNQAIAPIAAPQEFKGELRPYQALGVGWLAFLERWGLGACLADDMGLGKTIQLIAFLLHLQEQNALVGPTLLVCPTSVLGNWEREVKRFAPKLKTLIHHGAQRAQGKAFVKAVKAKDLIITSYPLVYRDESALKSVTWQGLVLDEAQNIKNPEARQSQAVRQLEAQFRIALTGTPLENRLSELWSILDVLNPGYLGPRNFFQRRFATPIERYGDMASLQTLRSLVQPFILRRLKTDREIIQDLPEKQEITAFCGLTSEQVVLYQQIVQASLAEIEASDGIQRRGKILATLVKLKQICNHPAQFLRESSLNGQHNRSGKLKRLEEMLEEALAEGDRALIFTQFAELGKLLQRYLEAKLHQETLLLYGGTSKPQREAMVDRFQHDPQGPRIFILSLKAGGVGLNLTRANHVFHFDRWWNPAVENQATDRVFRIGQTRNVQVHKFVCTGTLEEKIHEQIESKKALAEQVVGTGEAWLTELDTEQLRNLLLLERNAVIDEEA